MAADSRYKPTYMACMPKSRRIDPKFEKKLIAVLMKKHPGSDPKEIKKFIFDMEKWNYNRDEFTGFIRSRYIFTYALMEGDRKDEYYLVWLNFMQNNRFMGRLFHEIYLRSILKVYRIKKDDTHTPCR